MRASEALVLYYRSVDAWVIKKRDTTALGQIRRRKEALTIGKIIAAIGFPVLLALILMAIDIRSDLSELRPAKQLADPSTALIGWPDLDGPEGRPVELEHALWLPHPRVKMLGYMMDGYSPSPDGSQVDVHPDA